MSWFHPSQSRYADFFFLFELCLVEIIYLNSNKKCLLFVVRAAVENLAVEHAQE